MAVTRPNQVWAMDITYVPPLVHCCAIPCRAMDQGRQFTSIDFTELLKDAKISISMDGKSAWRDNRMIERFWRSIKYEEIYLHAYTNVPEARAGIEKYIKFYNQRRPHSSLAGPPPDQAYCNQAKPIPVAA